ncbi:MAG: haloalkane dehalogenase [Pseudomonadota bacterium]
MEFVRTPDEHFAGLPDWPYEPNYTNIPVGDGESLRMAYIDEGPRDAAHTFLCLHGQPTWSYLYRHMIPVFLGSGARVVAPDLLGMGRSDKPVDDAVYTFDFHRNVLQTFLRKLDLKNVTLVCQDWGGILGLTLPMDDPDRFDRLIVMNTALPVGESLGQGFADWRAYTSSKPEFSISGLMKRSVPTLSEAEAAAYDAPFPSERHRASIRTFPKLVMTEPEMNGADTMKRARDWWSKDWTGESFMAVGLQDPVFGLEVMEGVRSHIKGCPEPFPVSEGGHFVQEHGKQIAEAALRAFGKN